MSTIELKKHIMHLVQITDDEGKLMVVYNALKTQNVDESLLASIGLAKTEAEAGLGVSHEKSMEKYSKWL